MSFTKNTVQLAQTNKVLSLDDAKNQVIDIKQLQANARKLSAGLIEPAREVVHTELAAEHTSDPIKSLDVIDRISHHLKDSERWRDYMLFIVGINFGLRASDLRMLRFSNLITENFMFKDRFPVFERKTRNTRKRKVNRYITINDAVIEAVTLYLEHTPNISLSDYMFRSISNRGSNKNEPISVRGINYFMSGLARDLELNMHISTHTLRKTFCYWLMVQSNNDPRRLLLLQKMLGHATAAQTLDYIGITSEEIEDAYRNLNLGSEKFNYMRGSGIVELEAQTG